MKMKNFYLSFPPEPVQFFNGVGPSDPFDQNNISEIAVGNHVAAIVVAQVKQGIPAEKILAM